MGFHGRRGLASVFIELILSASSLEKVIHQCRHLRMKKRFQDDDDVTNMLTTARELQGVFVYFQSSGCLYCTTNKGFKSISNNKFSLVKSNILPCCFHSAFLHVPT
jgi:hypothetical protein